MNHNWSATKRRLHPQSVAGINRHSVLSGQDLTMWDIVWVSPQGHRSVSVSRHFLLQAPQCPCSVRKWFSRDHYCRERSKSGCRIVGSHTRWELTSWAECFYSDKSTHLDRLLQMLCLSLHHLDCVLRWRQPAERHKLDVVLVSSCTVTSVVLISAGDVEGCCRQSTSVDSRLYFWAQYHHWTGLSHCHTMICNLLSLHLYISQLIMWVVIKMIVLFAASLHVLAFFCGTMLCASHWPCVIVNSGLSTYRLNSLWKGDEHPQYC